MQDKAIRVHLKEIICGSLDMLANLVTVRMTIENGSKIKHVQHALEKIRAV
jgi:hypothetical protein